MLSKRQQQILTFLLEKEGFATIHHLAMQFNVSERTIQYDLEYLESMAQQLSLEIARNKNKGIKIKRHSEYMNRESVQFSSIAMHYSRDERELYIILKLFESIEPTSSQSLASLVSVSRRTIVEDLKRVQTWVESQGLRLEYVKNKGFVIKGDESNYRKAYADRVNAYFQTHTHNIGHQLFSNKELESIRRTVTETLFETQYQLVQSAIDGLIYHILIAIHRTREDFVFDIPTTEYQKLAQTSQFIVAKQIQSQLESNFNITFPKSEAAFITLHLLGAKTSDIHDDNNVVDDLEIMVEQLIERMSGDLGIDLMADNKLLNGLVVHLRPAIHRLQFEMSHPNPLNDEIQKEYQQLIESIHRHIWGIEELFQISFTADELSYITLHFASAIERISKRSGQAIKVILLCGSGVGTSQLLKSRLSHIYPELEIVDAYSIYEVNDTLLKHEKIDYIISTVPFEQSTVPVVQVSPFLNKSDRQQLNEIINQAREQYVAETKRIGPNLIEVLSETRVLTEQQSVSRDKAIQQCVALLEADGIVDGGYADDIITQLENFGPYMVISPHIALIHAKHEHVKQSVGFSLVHYTNGITFNHSQYDPVYIVVTLATKQPQIHLNALRQLSELIMDARGREDLFSGDKRQIMNWIKDVSKS
ncbi:BglG family transcription antiterminator [Staphylococcus gallinarum]|uniref:BglG family transcription antiterminator n=1 Tax=Staphylococcus gallinarum TaxID=1293 RepID=UPI000D1C3D33|nr:BglG family transcription antiterminator [Staphylococcus gallinarum]MBU7217233.1 BglG family transcription antiterminator [Staphylococcus gallinarum]MCD8792383.1 BglG family transcription antiterminator [Staphylococcus gallinarum]PTE38190.1 PTS sugar transporter subunit IIA [Staphylococcus gallinarum]PTK92660.1 PTS sugar transporter subunit IIA [Staphylococcus gallinarum]RIL22754.1 PRD domain-containing protein [Staphylococcus gallinarum]